MTIIVTVNTPGIKTYGELKSDVADWLARDDLDTQIKRFIRFAESDICKDLFVRGQEKTQTYTVTSGVETLPSDFRGARRLFVDVTGDNRELDYLAPEVFRRSRVATMAGSPSAYTVEGNNLVLAPAPGVDAPVTVNMLYIGTYDTMVDDADTNSLLEKHYDLFLYSALYHGFSYIRDNEEALKYKRLYDEFADKINRNANRERFRGNNLKRFGGPTP